MTTSAASVASTTPADQPQGFVVRIVGAAAFSAHLLNDLIQAVLPSIYPMLKSDFALSFAQIGWIALVYQVTASCCSPGSACSPTNIHNPSCCPPACW